MQTTSHRDLAVGFFVLAGLVLIAYMSLQVGGLSLRDPGGLVLFATFDDIGGLSPRSSVRIGGVRVGRVESIALDEDFARPRSIELGGRS